VALLFAAFTSSTNGDGDDDDDEDIGFKKSQATSLRMPNKWHVCKQGQPW
jgi:hypothetical protein